MGVNNDTCALCEYLVQTIDVLIKNKTTPAAANETAYKICDALPEPLKDTVSLTLNFPLKNIKVPATVQLWLSRN